MSHAQTGAPGRRPIDSTDLVHVIAAHHARMVAVATRVLHDDDDARDAVQDAYASAVRHLDRFDGRARLSTWLHRIVVNAALMRRRTRARRREEPLDGLVVAADVAGPDAVLQSRELDRLVRRSLAELPASERRVLELHALAGHDAASTARTLGVTRGALRTRAHRARRALRVRLASYAQEIA